MPERHVVLIGLPRDARTRVARLLAVVLERPFAEADELLELSTGRTLPQLHRERREAEVRRLEGRLVAEMLGRHAPLVISAPEPSEVGPEARSLVAESAVVVWMRDGDRVPTGPPALGHELADRVVDIKALQSLDGDAEPLIVGHILELLTAGDLPGPVRLPSQAPRAVTDGDAAPLPLDDTLAELYREVADLVVDVEPFHSVDDDPTGEIARHIVDLLALREPDEDATE